MVNNYKTFDDKGERKCVRMQALLGFGLATLFVVAMGLAIHHDKINFGRCLKMSPRTLMDLGPRVKFVLQQTAPGLIWIVFCIMYVIGKRGCENVLLPQEDTLAVDHAKNILTNSVEQYVLLFASQLALVTYLSGKQALNIIPTINLLYIVGRIFFFLGYPNRRSFGFLLGFEPILLSVGYVGYRYAISYLRF